MSDAITVVDSDATKERAAEAAAVKAREAAQEKERERLAKRAELRRKAAIGQIEIDRRESMRQAVVESDARLDELAANHVTECQPLQQELASLENQQVERVLSRGNTDRQQDARREELRAKIDAANAQLEIDLCQERQRIAPIKRELERHRQALIQCNYMTDLQSPESIATSLGRELFDLGRSDLVIAWRVAESAHQWAERRLGSAQQYVAQSIERAAYANAPRDSGEWMMDFGFHRPRRTAPLTPPQASPLALAILAAAQAEFDRTSRAMEEAYQAILDE